MSSVINWFNAHKYGRQIIEKLVEEFGEVEVVEHYNDYFKLKVARVEGKSIGFLFGLIEDIKKSHSV